LSFSHSQVYLLAHRTVVALDFACSSSGSSLHLHPSSLMLLIIASLLLLLATAVR
jgi:hypothetical protein